MNHKNSAKENVNIIVKKITLAATPEQVFLALTNENTIIKYFPLDKVVSTWELGSEVLYIGNVGGTPFTDYGTITELWPAKKYSYRYWSDNHGTARISENFVTISYQLAATKSATKGTDIKEKSTMLTLTQSNLPSAEMYQVMDTQVWDVLLNNFKNYVENNK